MPTMRTTITLDSDVAKQLKTATIQTGRPFRSVVNEALRSGLAQLKKPAKPKRYRTKPHNMGLRPGLSLDNIQQLLGTVGNEG